MASNLSLLMLVLCAFITAEAMKLTVSKMWATNLPCYTDAAYVRADLDGVQFGKTKSIYSPNPKWPDRFEVFRVEPRQILKFSFYDKDIRLGHCCFTIKGILERETSCTFGNNNKSRFYFDYMLN